MAKLQFALVLICLAHVSPSPLVQVLNPGFETDMVVNYQLSST